MKKGIAVGMIVILLILGMVSTVTAQSMPPSIPLALEGVEGCRVEHQGITYYPQGNVMILTGVEGEKITITKGEIIKTYLYVNPMENPILYIDMATPETIADYHPYCQLPFLERVLMQLTRMAGMAGNL